MIEGRDQRTKMSAGFLPFKSLEGLEFVGIMNFAFEIEGLF